MPSFAQMSGQYQPARDLTGPYEDVVPPRGADTGVGARGVVAEPDVQIEPGLQEYMCGLTHSAKQSGMRRAMR